MSKQCETSCTVQNLENTNACDCSSSTSVLLEASKQRPSARTVWGLTLGGALMLGARL